MKLIALALVACSAPATLPELAAAEHSESAGQTDQALAQYRAAQDRCGALRPRRRATLACSQALLGEAELLEHAQRTDAALTAYLAIPGRVTDDNATAAIALDRAGLILLHAERTTEAWTALWKVVTDYPDEGVAADAVKTLLDDGRGRDPRALADQFGKVLGVVAESQVADNLVWSLADLDAHELANPEAARALYDRIPKDFPDSGLRDDARWFAAQLSEQLGDWKGAEWRLRALLDTREVAIGPGSYFSVWLDDAQLELGKIMRDQFQDRTSAVAIFRLLLKNYPASILRDDALYEIAVTYSQVKDDFHACSAVGEIRKLEPESKYLERPIARACK